MLITKMITVGLGSRSSVEITRERGGFTFKIALVLLKRLTWVHLTFEIAKNNFFIRNFYRGRVKNVTLCIGGDEGETGLQLFPCPND